MLHSELRIGKGIGWTPGTTQVKEVKGVIDGLLQCFSKDHGMPHFRWTSTCGCTGKDWAARKGKHDCETAAGFSIDGVDALKRTCKHSLRVVPPCALHAPHAACCVISLSHC